ncbi:MAG TPA: DUF3108 domain-containing protein [Xanthobacteraceae bacterium]|nr:DUF3108 domain-containing protein [Xanthobacteraceae bacterium]
MSIRPLHAFLALACLVAPAHADGRLEAKYKITLAGITVGAGTWTLDVSEEGYSGSASGKVAGVLRLFASGEGSATARGQIAAGKVVPTSFTLNSTRGSKTDHVRIAMAANVVRDFSAEPPPSPGGDRVPLTPEHKKGVVDPGSAAILPVSGAGDLLRPDACNRTVPVFDGRQRYDLVMSYDRMETAKDVKGYSGQLVICHIAYRPVAGHRSGREDLITLADNHTIEAWFGPVAGSRVLVPVRVSLVTSFGTLVVQATQFSAEPTKRQALQPETR